MKNLVAIIVGGTGQFGIITSEFLLKKNYKVIITTRSINKKKKLFKKHINLKLYKLDIYNKIKINKLLYKYKPNLVFYFAGQSSPVKSFLCKKETYKSNVLGCKNFLDVILKNNYNCKFVNATSCEMYGKINNKIGKPTIKLRGTTANFLKKKIKNKKYAIYLSLSDDEPWAQATVIISYNK